MSALVTHSSTSVPKLATAGPAVLVHLVAGLLHRYSNMDFQSSWAVSEILDVVILAGLLRGWVGAGASLLCASHCPDHAGDDPGCFSREWCCNSLSMAMEPLSLSMGDGGSWAAPPPCPRVWDKGAMSQGFGRAKHPPWLFSWHSGISLARSHHNIWLQADAKLTGHAGEGFPAGVVQRWDLQWEQ